MTQTNKSVSFSQYGEDHLVWQFFGQSETGFFVDVGAHDGETFSQSLFLERHGWRGILIEPQSACCAMMRIKRPAAQVFQVACGAPEQRGSATLQLDHQGSKLVSESNPAQSGYEETQVMTLDDILGQVSHPPIDFLSIDVEGFELQVLRGFNIQKYHPRLLIVEDNLPNRLKVHWHLKGHGYRLVKRTGCNNWYVPRGQSFPFSTSWEHARLYRKMYLGTVFRRFRSWIVGH